MMVPETQNTPDITSFTILETQKSPELSSVSFQEIQKTLTYHWKYHILLKDPHQPTEKYTRHDFTSFKNIFMKELEAIKGFTK